MKPTSVIEKALTNEGRIESLDAKKQIAPTEETTDEKVTKASAPAVVCVPVSNAVPTAAAVTAATIVPIAAPKIVSQPIQVLKPVGGEPASPMVVAERKIVKAAVDVEPEKVSVAAKKDAPETKTAAAGKSETAEGLTQAPVAMEIPVANQILSPAVAVAVASAPMLDAVVVASGMVKRPDALVVGENKVSAKDGRKVAGPVSRVESGAKRELVTTANVAPVSQPRVGDGAQPAAHAFAEAAVHAVSGLAVTPTGIQATIAPAVAASVVGAPVRENGAGHPASGVHANADGDGAYGGIGSGETRTLTATPNVLEVGITGGAHGWLRVRAEMGHTGEVTASLVASNAGSAETLHKELGAMTAYLKSESVGVSSLTVTAPEKNSGAQAAATYGSGSGAGYGSGFGSGASGQGGRRDSDHSAGTGGTAGVWDEAAMASGFAGSGMVPAAMLGDASGGWLSVRV